MDDLLSAYFESYNRQDIKKLRVLLSKDVSLIDWEQKLNGRDSVLELASKTFSTFPSLKIVMTNVFSTNYKACCEICVRLNEKTSLDVVDVFDIDNGKIVQIRAYRK